jgi:hypothetical protein
MMKTMKSMILFFKCLFVWWKPQGDKNPSEAQVIVTQAGSDLVDGSTAQTNVDLANIAREYHEKLGIPIFAQGEVARALDNMNVPVAGRTPREAIPDNFGSREYQGTSGVAALQKKYCDEHGFTKVLVVAFVPHIWRAKWTYEKQGFQVLVPPDLPWYVFETDANQRRWRRAVVAYPYELKARFEYLFKSLI